MCEHVPHRRLRFAHQVQDGPDPGALGGLPEQGFPGTAPGDRVSEHHLRRRAARLLPDRRVGMTENGGHGVDQRQFITAETQHSPRRRPLRFTIDVLLEFGAQPEWITPPVTDGPVPHQHRAALGQVDRREKIRRPFEQDPLDSPGLRMKNGRLRGRRSEVDRRDHAQWLPRPPCAAPFRHRMYDTARGERSNEPGWPIC